MLDSLLRFAHAQRLQIHRSARQLQVIARLEQAVDLRIATLQRREKCLLDLLRQADEDLQGKRSNQPK